MVSIYHTFGWKGKSRFHEDFLRLKKTLSTESVTPAYYDDFDYLKAIASRHMVYLCAECMSHMMMKKAGLPIHEKQISREEAHIKSTALFLQTFGLIDSRYCRIYWDQAKEKLSQQWQQNAKS